MPHPVAGIDMRQLPIGPEEAFVLSRVDGRSSEADIVAATGLDSGKVRSFLTRLEELGAIRYAGAAPPPPPEQPSSSPPQGRLAHPVIEAPVTAPPDAEHPAAALYDPAELDEVVDVDLPRKRKVLDYFYRLDSASHYEILALDPKAERKEVKAAYFKIVPEFHPDRYFGKNLGSFKSKLEKVFQRLTEAHDVLSRAQTRAAYDEYLATQRRTHDFERMMSDERSRNAELEEARRRIEQEASIAERISQAPPMRGSVVPVSDPESRKRALARKLMGSISPPARSATPPPVTNRAAIQEHVAEELRKRYEARLAGARDNQVKHYVDAAETAIKTKDLVSAANALRIAVSLAPDDAEVKTRFEDVQARANAELADTYLQQAKYEESNKHFLEAAASYEKAARGKPGAVIYDRAAACLLEGSGDLRKAGDLARKAVGLAPKQTEPRVTLARVYLAAGMKESALAEFERASQLDPSDDTIKDWIKRIKRGEV